MPLSRLAIDASRALVTPRTGTEWYSLEIIQALAALHPRPSMSLYIRHDQRPDSLPADALVRSVAMPRMWTHIGLSLAVARDRPDALFVPAHVVPLHHPKATIVTIHDLGYKREPRAHPRRARLMLDLTTRWSVYAARRVVVLSRQTRDDLVELYGVPSEKIFTVPSGVNPDRFHPLDHADVEARLSELGITRPYLLYLSTVQPRKNVERLVAAFEQINDPDLRLVIAGRTGWLAGAIERRIMASPVRQRIDRLGYVASDARTALYSGAEAFILPSLYEGFGMGVLEAMACGCPVVASNTSSIPEVAGDAAILVDPLDVTAIRDGILRARAPETRRRLIRRGLQRAQEFTWTRAAQQTMHVIRDAYATVR